MNKKKDKKMTKNDKTFGEIYKALPDPPKIISPKLKFIQRIASVTQSSENAVRMWVSGRQRPDALKQAIISKELGVPSDTLFPIS